MSKTLMKTYIELSSLQSQYIKQYKNLQNYISSALTNIDSVDKLDRFELKFLKEEKKLITLHKNIEQAVSKFGTTNKGDKSLQNSFNLNTDEPVTKIDSKKIAKVIVKSGRESVVKFDQLLKKLPTSEQLYQKIEEKRQLLKFDCEKKLKVLNAQFEAGKLTSKELNNFLFNPKVKSKIKYDPFFASKVKQLDSKFILRSAETIASINHAAFIKVTRDELLAPWDYEKNLPSNLNLKDCIKKFNAISLVIKDEILNAKDMEERTLITERWIWVAQYLYQELNDYSGFFSVYSAINSTAVSRLEKTFEGISPEATKVFEELNPIKYKFDFLKAALDNPQPVIPFLGQLLTDFTFSLENPWINDEKDKNRKKVELAERTEGGLKRILAFDMLQARRKKILFNVKGDKFLADSIQEMVAKGAKSDADEEYNKSTQIEPSDNKLQPAKPIRLGQVIKTPSHTVYNNLPTPRQLIGRELVYKAASIFSDLESQAFNIGLDNKIDWQAEKKRFATNKHIIDSNIAALKEYSSKEPVNSSVFKEASKLINKFENFDDKALKTKKLEERCKFDLFQIKSEIVQTEKAMTKAWNFPVKETSSHTANGIQSMLMHAKQRLQHHREKLATINEYQDKVDFSEETKNALAAATQEITVTLEKFEKLLNRFKENTSHKSSFWHSATPSSSTIQNSCSKDLKLEEATSEQVTLGIS